jgi:hypothetical protein
VWPPLNRGKDIFEHHFAVSLTVAADRHTAFDVNLVVGLIPMLNDGTKGRHNLKPLMITSHYSQG